MDSRALTRLRVAFVLLAAALLAPLALLARSMEARLEAQRRLRHEIVAERIFDEMERELTSLLETESARSTDAYSAESTRVEHWAPFVVGYFTRDAAGVHIVAQSQIDGARSVRLRSALTRPSGVKKQLAHEFGGKKDSASEESLGAPAPTAAAGIPEQNEPVPVVPVVAPKSKALAEKELGARAPAAAILKQLNRGGDEREKVQRKLEIKRRDAKNADPLAESF